MTTLFARTLPYVMASLVFAATTTVSAQSSNKPSAKSSTEGATKTSASSSSSKSGSKSVGKTSVGKTTALPTLMGQWAGTATVPLPDSAIVVPVFYNFTDTAGALGGTAMVPGQGTGPISNVVRSGTHIQFRVTAPENRLLEHDGVFGADGAIEGMVNLNKQPVAKFRILPKSLTKAAK